MKWKLRPGFLFFDSKGEEIEYRAGNPTIRPRGMDGKFLILTQEQLREIYSKGMLGALVPCDAEAEKCLGFFGNPAPLVAKRPRMHPPAQVSAPSRSAVVA